MAGFDNLSPPNPEIAARVKAPAIAMLVVAISGILWCLFYLIWNLAVGLPEAVAEDPNSMWVVTVVKAYMAFSVLGLITAVVICFGAIKMQKLQTHGLCVSAAILAAVPCISPCCWLGVPIGIWAVMVLLDPSVKAAFR